MSATSHQRARRQMAVDHAQKIADKIGVEKVEAFLSERFGVEKIENLIAFAEGQMAVNALNTALADGTLDGDAALKALDRTRLVEAVLDAGGTVNAPIVSYEATQALLAPFIAERDGKPFTYAFADDADGHNLVVSVPEHRAFVGIAKDEATIADRRTDPEAYDWFRIQTNTDLVAEAKQARADLADELDMSRKKLEEHATGLGIDVTGAKSIGEVVDAIKAHKADERGAMVGSDFKATHVDNKDVGGEDHNTDQAIADKKAADEAKAEPEADKQAELDAGAKQPAAKKPAAAKAGTTKG